MGRAVTSRRGRREDLIRHRAVPPQVAKAELSGTVTAFRRNKHRQDSYQTIVHVASREDAGNLMGARVVWLRKDGLQIRGRVVASHGSKGAVRVRRSRGFPPQALGSHVKMLC